MGKKNTHQNRNSFYPISSRTWTWSSRTINRRTGVTEVFKGIFLLFLFLLNLLEWHWSIKLCGFHIYKSQIHHLSTGLCAHQPKSSLLPSSRVPLSPLLPPRTPLPSSHPSSMLLSVSMSCGAVVCCVVFFGPSPPPLSRLAVLFSVSMSLLILEWSMDECFCMYPFTPITALPVNSGLSFRGILGHTGWNLCIEPVDRTMGTQGLILTQPYRSLMLPEAPHPARSCVYKELFPTPSYSIRTEICHPINSSQDLRFINVCHS